MNLLASFLEDVSSEHTRRAYHSDLRRFFGGGDVEASDVRSVTPDAIQTFVRSMYEEGLAESTQRRRLAALRRFYDCLVEQGIVSQNPARAPQVKPRPPASEPSDTSLLSKDEVQRLIDIAGEADKTGPRDQALILTIVYGALRRSEVAGMRVEDVRPLGRQWVIDLQPDSSAKGGYVRIPNVVVEAIERVQTRYGIDAGALWRSLSNRNRGVRLTPDAIYKVVRRTARRADLGGVTTETLRQTGLHLALDAGATIQQVQFHARLQSASSIERLDDTDGRKNRFNESVVDFLDFSVLL